MVLPLKDRFGCHCRYFSSAYFFFGLPWWICCARKVPMKVTVFLVTLLLIWAQGQGGLNEDYRSSTLQPLNFESGDMFGRSVALSKGATWAVIGAPHGNFESSVKKNQTNTGVAYVFQRNGALWVQTAKLYPHDPHRAAEFGKSVAIDDQGLYVAVGTFQGDSSTVQGSGNAYVFYRSTDSWGDDHWTELPTILEANNPGPDDKFGSAIAMDPTGNWIVVGAYACCNAINDPTRGAAYVFRRDGEGASARYSFVQQLEVPPQDVQRFAQFGQFLAVSDDALTVAVGAMFQDDTGVNGQKLKHAGAVFVWGRTHASTPSFTYEQTLRATSPASYALFGCGISISSGRMAIGARNHDANRARMLAAGVVFMFQYDATRALGSRWFNPLTSPDFVRPDVSVSSDRFGHAVALSDTWLYVGGYDSARTTSAKVYVFRLEPSSGKWRQVAFLTDPTVYPANVAKYGYALASQGYYVIMGSPNDRKSRPNDVGYAVVSVPRAYQCNGFGSATVDSNGVITCACDSGFFPPAASTINGQPVSECTICDTAQGYFPRYGISQEDLHCLECSGHGTWNSNTATCTCNRGWQTPSVADALPCSTCALGFSGPYCAGVVTLRITPPEGVFLQTSFALAAFGVDISQSLNVTFQWYWRHLAQNTTFADWQVSGKEAGTGVGQVLCLMVHP